ncbi:MAG: hypothetical protein H6731_03005 [Myxococcales bacterium]|nr:MAG: hypothetical protein H6731_03005 [Myxococcales bacterium]
MIKNIFISAALLGLTVLLNSCDKIKKDDLQGQGQGQLNEKGSLGIETYKGFELAAQAYKDKIKELNVLLDTVKMIFDVKYGSKSERDAAIDENITESVAGINADFLKASMQEDDPLALEDATKVGEQGRLHDSIHNLFVAAAKNYHLSMH